MSSFSRVLFSKCTKLLLPNRPRRNHLIGTAKNTVGEAPTLSFPFMMQTGKFCQNYHGRIFERETDQQIFNYQLLQRSEKCYYLHDSNTIRFIISPVTDGPDQHLQIIYEAPQTKLQAEIC
ncbi:hypothetical protein ACJX0J_038395 [Zea mays]